MIATSLRELRARFPLTIRGLAFEAGISPTTYMHIEAGRRIPHPSTMVRIASVLGVKLSEVEEFVRAMEVHRAGMRQKGGQS